jgi:hypothetical protein
MYWREGIAATMLSLVAAGGLHGQTCQNVPTYPSGDTAGAWVVRTASPACTPTDGGFIKSQESGEPSAAYKVHFRATSTGSCQTRNFGCYPCQCYDGAVYARNLGTSSVFRNGTLVGYVAAQGGVMTYDTSVPTGTLAGGFNWKPTVEGTFTFTSTVQVNVTPCNLQPFSFPGEPFQVHVMACKPEWFTGPGDVNFHAPPGPITIAVPPGFEDVEEAAQAAAADWEARLGKDITVSPNATCAANDPLCASFTNDHGTLPGDSGCASFRTATYSTSTGAWAGSTAVRLELNWNGGHPDNLRWTVAHELGHYLGWQIGYTPAVAKTTQ